LIGVLNLGPRRSEQGYSSDDMRLVSNLAIRTAAALRVAHLVHQQQFDARQRERIEQELRVARLVQETLLPKEVPSIPGWELAAHWQPAREMSGDFYDFLPFPDGRLGLIIGDVAGKGMPAALVMAITQSILHATAERIVPPAEVLERANNLILPHIPANMFATCLYMILDPVTGCLLFANAGHNLPILQTNRGWWSRAPPACLGLLPGMTYDQNEVRLTPGHRLLMYTDGLVEAHNPQGEMFGIPYLHSLIGQEIQVLPGSSGGAALIDLLLASLAGFTGTGWEQEDDVTLVTLDCLRPGWLMEDPAQIETGAEGTLPDSGRFQAARTAEERALDH
jgi:serine phosphatase RsbU (regulator of sigma subunit)